MKKNILCLILLLSGGMTHLNALFSYSLPDAPSVDHSRLLNEPGVNYEEDIILVCNVPDLTVECNSLTSSTISSWLTTQENILSNTATHEMCDGDFSVENDSASVTFSLYCTITDVPDTVTFTVTDTCGNSASCIGLVFIIDVSPPVVNEAAPADVTISCTDPLPMNPPRTATDNCATFGSKTGFDESNGEGCGDVDEIITRSWVFIDGCGNIGSVEQLITVTADNEAPTFTCPSNETVCETDIPTVPTGLTGSDNCDASPSVSFVAPEVSTKADIDDCNYTITRKFKAEDYCGNVTTCEQTITVEDNEPPMFVEVCPSSTTVCKNNIPVAATLTATDNCDDMPTVTPSESTTKEDDMDCDYTITRTWTATDGCGNTASCMQVITVIDITPPVLIGCPSDETLMCEDEVPDPPDVTATDNCASNLTVDFDEQTSGSECERSITRTWTVDDGCGNTASCVQVINYDDVPLPVELISFKAEMKNKHVHLSWTTSSEYNSDVFVIEKSLNGLDFNQIGNVPAAGNSQALLNYEYIDNSRVRGTVYYRLKQIDQDSQWEYSPIESVKSNTSTSVDIIWPNPVKDVLNIQLNRSIETVVIFNIYDLNGRLILHRKEDSGIFNTQIDLSEFNSGIFLLEVKTAGFPIFSEKIVKN